VRNARRFLFGYNRDRRWLTVSPQTP
jgi:hypothetical protein